MKYTTVSDNYIYVADARQADLPSSAVNVKQFQEGAVFGIPRGTSVPAHWVDNLRNTRDRAMTDALDAGDKFVTYDQLCERWSKPEPEMEHEPGCSYFRQRPCNCQYLQSWGPKQEEAHAYTLAADTPWMDFGIESAYLVPTSGTITVEWTRPTADTPQSRDEERRSGLTTMEQAQAALAEQRAREKFSRESERAERDRQRAKDYELAVNKAYPKMSTDPLDRERYWKGVARTQSTILIYFGLTAIGFMGALVTKIQGWW